MQKVPGDGRILGTAVAAGLLCAAAMLAQEGIANYISVIREGPDLLLDLGAGATGPADRIELRLNKAVSRDATLEFGPQGWTGRSEGATVILEGPGLELFPALFRLRVGAGKIPPVTHVRAKLFGETIAERDVVVAQAPPAVTSEGLDGLLAVPWIVFAGEGIVARALIPQATPPLGRWSFGGRPAVAEGESVQIEIPIEADGETALAGRYEDPWGRAIASGEVRLQVEPRPVQARRQRVEGVQPVALAGEALTVCGWFPRGFREGVLLDGRPVLEVVGGSMRSLVLSLPPRTPPGRHLVSGDPDRGFPDGIFAFRVIRLDTSVDRAMEPPTIRIRVEGAEEPVRVRVVNLDPFAASLVGGDSQVVETDGGRENVAFVAMQPSRYADAEPRNLDIAFTLARTAVACEAPGDPAAPGVSPGSAPGARVAN